MNVTIPTAGRFIWYELVTPEKDASKKFYSTLLDWQWQDEDMGDMGIYPMGRTGKAYQCGLVSPPQEGIPAHWMAYVTVEDVDQACGLAETLGGKVMTPPMDIPKVGRFAALADPSGAVILPFQGTNPAPPENPESTPPGFFCWNELLTNDTETCSTFYQKIFGWKVESSEMPGIGKYWLFNRGPRQECGMMAMPESAAAAKAPPHWLPYISVGDVDAAVATATGLGATVYCQPTDIPKVGRFAVMSDPQGAVFAAFNHA